MALLARYRTDTGQIVGIWESTNPTTLEANRQADDPGHAYLQVDGMHPQALQERYGVRDGTLTAHALLTLTASPPSFVANGIEVCQITVTPFVPCTLLLNGVAYALTRDDPTLEVTSHTPMLLVVELAPQSGLWAQPLTVEARDA